MCTSQPQSSFDALSAGNAARVAKAKSNFDAKGAASAESMTKPITALGERHGLDTRTPTEREAALVARGPVVAAPLAPNGQMDHSLIRDQEKRRRASMGGGLMGGKTLLGA